MSELRFNRATGDWVILAPIRDKQQVRAFSCLDADAGEDRGYVDNCPFCEGNEWMTLPEVTAVRDRGSAPNEPGWQVRVVPDKFPALSRIRTGIQEREDEFFFRVEGYGVHENVIESPRHNMNISNVSDTELAVALRVMVQRYRLFESDPKIQFISIFRNRGRRAGATLLHPHSQIIASPYVPPLIARRVRVADRYWQRNKRCVFCDMLDHEVDAGSRVALATRRFMAVHPFASASPYETWIIPRKHRHRFGAITSRAVEELAGVINRIVLATREVYRVPDYHMFVASSPVGDKHEKSYHWHLRFVPRLTPATSAEMHSGVRVTTIPPEVSARRIRECLAEHG